MLGHSFENGRILEEQRLAIFVTVYKVPVTLFTCSAQL